MNNKQALIEALEDMAYQFAYKNDGHKRTPPSLMHGGLSALEHTFRLIGWDNPHYCPEESCDVFGCQNWTGAGIPLPDGDYLTICGDHYWAHNAGEVLRKKVGRGYNSKERKERLARR